MPLHRRAEFLGDRDLPGDRPDSRRPVRVRVRLPDGVSGRRIRLLVSDRTPALSTSAGSARFELDSIIDHEVAVIE